MSVTRKAVGFAIEGVGSDASFSGGLCWYWGRQLTSAIASGSNYEWLGGMGTGEGLVDLPEGIDFTTDLWTGDVQGNAMAVELHLSDFTAELFLYQPTDSTLSLDVDLTDVVTTVDIVGPTADLPADASVVWCGDEAILLGTSSGITGGKRYTGCTRGYWNTTGVALLEGMYVFTKCPFFTNRIVRMFEIDRDTGTETQKWLGLVNEIETNDEGTRLSIDTSEIWGALSEARVNRGAPNLRAQGKIDLGIIIGNTKPSAAGTLNFKTLGKRVAKASVHGHKQAFQISTGLFFADESNNTTVSATPVQFVEFAFDGSTAYRDSGADIDAPRVKLRSTASVKSSQPRLVKGQANEEAVYEVFAVVRDLDQDGPDDLFAAADMYSSTRALTYPFHPVSIAMALWTSTRSRTENASATEWDVLGPALSIGIPLDWFDVSAISAMITKTASLKIDQLILGWDGAEVDAWTEGKRLLAAYGFFLGTTSAGLLTVLRAKEADVEDFSGRIEVLPIPFTLKHATRRGESVDVISGIANKLPWNEGEPFLAQAIDYTTLNAQTSLRASLFSERKSAELDMSTKADVDAVIEDLTAGIISRRQSWPRIMIEVGHADTYDLGAFVIFESSFGNVATNRLTKKWFVDNTGTRAVLPTTVNTDAQWLGLIVGRTYNIERGTYTLELILTNFRLGKYPLWRAPAMTITSYSTTTLTNDTFHCSASSAFEWPGGADSLSFTVDDVIEVQDQVGNIVAGTPRTIGTVNATSIVLTSGSSFAPTPGSLVVLANLESGGYPQAGNANIFSVLAYAFMADSDETLTSAELPGHIYGSGRA
ncbi:MAG TPA: hypothetical protein VM487_00335 [Phycisphaerae bacterium]|nr:hypothetical protein [Phycisphaerae bacterium]